MRLVARGVGAAGEGQFVLDQRGGGKGGQPHQGCLCHALTAGFAAFIGVAVGMLYSTTFDHIYYDRFRLVPGVVPDKVGELKR